jgi:hypothetical protein
MGYICMNKSACNEPVILSVLTDGRRIKDQVVHDLLIAERTNGNDNCNDNYDQGN